jgi:hypothetical protein
VVFLQNKTSSLVTMKTYREPLLMWCPQDISHKKTLILVIMNVQQPGQVGENKSRAEWNPNCNLQNLEKVWILSKLGIFMFEQVWVIFPEIKFTQFQFCCLNSRIYIAWVSGV